MLAPPVCQCPLTFPGHFLSPFPPSSPSLDMCMFKESAPPLCRLISIWSFVADSNLPPFHCLFLLFYLVQLLYAIVSPVLLEQ